MGRVYFIFVVVFVILTISQTYASQSTITEAEGYACMNEDRTKRQTEELALHDAKRRSIEQVSTYIESETEVKDFELKKDIVNAYADAEVRIIEAEGRWDSEPPKIGDCYRLKIKAEVIPDEGAMKKVAKSRLMDDPSAPLHIQVWTDKKEYESGDKIKIYIKGNKPFYAIVLYKDVKGELLQLLPNPYRKENYFNGGTIYEIPSGNDRFELEVSPPFGEENIYVYASTSVLGDINVEDMGGVYQVKTRDSDIRDRVRGVKLKQKSEDKGSSTSEFFEGKTTLKTKGGKK